MSETQISLVAAPDAERAYATLSASFAENTFARWMFPDDDEFARYFPQFLAAVMYTAFDTHSAWQIDDFSAVALFLAPSVEPDPEGVSEAVLKSVDRTKFEDLFASLALMEDAHPRTPHWFLAGIGVDPAQRGSGLGGLLLAACLERIDGTGLPVYLESSDDRAVPFFERHGFVTTGRLEAGTAPSPTAMLRPGRSS
jgi:GNAT superfamily N-acetyltransferase